MPFLKKLGTVLVKATEIWFGFSGIAGALNPGAAGVIQKVDASLTQIAQIIIEVETIGQKLAIAGPQKLTAAAPLVAQVILQSSLLVGHKIHDEALFNKACGEIAGGFADLLNSLDENGVKTTDKT